MGQNPDRYVAGLRRLAEQGHAEAQFALGRMYRSGEGVPQDDTQNSREKRPAQNPIITKRTMGSSGVKGHYCKFCGQHVMSGSDVCYYCNTK